MAQVSVAALLLVVSIGATLFTGCGVGAMDHSVSQAQGSSLTGNVHGGQQPVSGSVIEIWIAGKGGYGTGATSALNVGTTITTDGAGNFQFAGDYDCADTDQLYITATGGNPGVSGSATNSAIALMAPLGACGPLKANAASMFININEVSTIASAYSLAQFAAANSGVSGIQVGTASGNLTGLANAMKTANNLFDLGTGQARAVTPFYANQGGTPGGLLNSSYVPQARINTLANVLASCINTATSDGSVSTQCASLFAAVTPPGGSAPVDTLQAALAIAQNPGHNVAAIFGMAGGVGAPFQPSLGSPAPTDWTLALTYEGGGLGLLPGQDPSNNVTEIGGLAIDEEGNIWMSGACPDLNNYDEPKVFELDNQGNGISPASTNSTCGGFPATFHGVAAAEDGVPLFTIAEDLNHVMWTTSYGAIVPFSSDGSVLHAAYAPTYPSQCSQGGAIYNIGVDISNNLWVTCDNGAGNGTAGILSSQDGTTIGSAVGSQFDFTNITFDLSGNMWAAQAATYTNPLADNTLNQYSVTIDPTSQRAPLISDHSNSFQSFHGAVAVDGLGNVYSPSMTPGTLVKLAPGSGGAYTASQLSYPALSGSAGMQQLVVDGNNHIWGVSYTGLTSATGFRTTNATAPTYLIEMDSNGTALSPTGTNSTGAPIYGYTGTGAGSETEVILANAVDINQSNQGSTVVSGMAIDGSGNLWLTNSSMASPMYNTVPAVVPETQQVVEFIGVAGPVRTPIVTALNNGEIGVLPQVVGGQKLVRK